MNSHHISTERPDFGHHITSDFCDRALPTLWPAAPTTAEKASNHQIENIGKELRNMMPFLDAKDIKKDI